MCIRDSGGTGNPLTTMSGIDVNENRFGAPGSIPTGVDPGTPTMSQGFIEAYVGPSAQFAIAVPEPSSFLFLSLVVTSGFAWRRRNILAEAAE